MKQTKIMYIKLCKRNSAKSISLVIGSYPLTVSSVSKDKVKQFLNKTNIKQIKTNVY